MTTSEQITAEVLKRWKITYSNGILKLVVRDFKGYIRQPSNAEMIKLYNAGLSVSKSLIEKLWIGGDIDLLNNDSHFVAIQNQIKTMLLKRQERALCFD